MLQFLIKNHWISYTIIAITVLIISTISLVLVFRVIELEQLKKDVNNSSYSSVIFDGYEDDLYDYYYDEILQTKNFVLNDTAFNIFLIMQSQNYSQMYDPIYQDFLNMEIGNLSEQEIILSKSIMDKYDLSLHETITLNDLNPIQYNIVGIIDSNIFAYYRNEIHNLPIGIIAYNENYDWSEMMSFVGDIDTLNSSSSVFFNDILLVVINTRIIIFDSIYTVIYITLIIGLFIVLINGLNLKEDILKYKESGYTYRKQKIIILFTFLSVIPWLIPLILFIFMQGFSHLLILICFESFLTLYIIWRLLP